jgi:hypothetical protein
MYNAPDNKYDTAAMHKLPATTNLFVLPGLFRDMARLGDLCGHLDEYRYSSSDEQADLEALRRDYTIALANLSNQVDDYARKKANT